MPDRKLKKDVPQDRTIIPGIWSDVLDDASVTFDIDEKTGAVRVNIKNLGEIGFLLETALSMIVDQNSTIIKELRLLNARTEEMADTGIEMIDIGEDDG